MARLMRLSMVPWSELRRSSMTSACWKTLASSSTWRYAGSGLAPAPGLASPSRSRATSSAASWSMRDDRRIVVLLKTALALTGGAMFPRVPSFSSGSTSILSFSRPSAKSWSRAPDARRMRRFSTFSCLKKSSSWSRVCSNSSTSDFSGGL